MKTYSPYFETIFEENSPPRLHLPKYTVLKANTFVNQRGELSKRMAEKRFVIFWDKDHDERVIAILEEMYVQNLLHYFDAFYEEKGILYVWFNDPVKDGDNFIYNHPIENSDEIFSKILGILTDYSVIEDQWNLIVKDVHTDINILIKPRELCPKYYFDYILEAFKIQRIYRHDTKSVIFTPNNAYYKDHLNFSELTNDRRDKVSKIYSSLFYLFNGGE